MATINLQDFSSILLLDQEALQRAGANHPHLAPAIRAFRALARRINRPMRIAILGESNAGKSSIANALIGSSMLPALPFANTRLPTRLYYSEKPDITAATASGQMDLSDSAHYVPEDVYRLDVGLPVDALRNLEIVDFPGAANPLFGFDMQSVVANRPDAAIWVTVATQAWRESEKTLWETLPAQMKRLSILVVSHTDLLASDADLEKLKSRLIPTIAGQFAELCFVSVRNSASHTRVDLTEKLTRITALYEANRLTKAVTIARRIAGKALARLE